MDSLIIPWVRSILETTPTRWTHLVETVPMDLLSLPPALKEWSALECLQHLVDTERWVFPARVKFVLAGQDFPAFDPDSQGSHPELQFSPQQLSAEFSRLRQEGLAAFSVVTVEDLSRQARHQELGLVTLGELIHEWAAHDLMHTIQAEQALMQPFIRGSGPWQRYFSAHDVRLKGSA